MLLTEIDCHDIINERWTKAQQNIEAWLSLVERYIRDVEVAGSNPVASIFFAKFIIKRIWKKLKKLLTDNDYYVIIIKSLNESDNKISRRGSAW